MSIAANKCLHMTKLFNEDNVVVAVVVDAASPPLLFTDGEKDALPLLLLLPPLIFWENERHVQCAPLRWILAQQSLLLLSHNKE